MTRRHFTFTCEGNRLAATLDQAAGSTALLLVSGGNEVRAGPWGSQAGIAAQIAAAGFPVLRFDRRGVGDSEGGNGGFRTSAADIGAALAALRREAAGVERVIAYGNCDAATALVLARGAGADGLVLSNPWILEDSAGAADQGEPGGGAPAGALRAHYLRRLTNPRALLRLLGGKVSLRALGSSLRAAVRPAAPPGALAQDFAAALSACTGPVRILLADNDRTAQAFLAGWDKRDPRLRRCKGASHSFVEAPARDWLLAQLLEALR